MDWLALGLALLKLVNLVLGWVHEEEWKAEGRKEALAQALAETARKVGVRDEILREVAKLSDAELDDKLHGLEPGPKPKPER